VLPPRAAQRSIDSHDWGLEPRFHIEPGESREVVHVPGDQDEAIHSGDCGDLAIDEWPHFAELAQACFTVARA
jgi:hypothetical protein